MPLFSKLFCRDSYRFIIFRTLSEAIFSIVVALTGFMILNNQGHDEKIKDYSEHFAYRIAKRIFPSYPKIVVIIFYFPKNNKTLS